MADLYEIRTTWTGVAGTPYYTTIRGLLSGAVTPEQMNGFWKGLLANLAPGVDNGLSATISPESRIIDSGTGKLVGVSTITGGFQAMTGPGDVLPPANQLLIRFGTNQVANGKRQQGSINIPGQLESNNDANGNPSAGLISSVKTYVQNMLDVTRGTWVIYSPTNHSFATVQTVDVAPFWAVLRSRRD